MKKTLVYLMLITFPMAGYGAEVKCYGWYQSNGAEIETVPMPVISLTANSKTYAAEYKGYVYRAHWHFQLTSFNISFETKGTRILTTTARVPSENHPENFTDLNLPGGPRLSITCEL